MEKECFVAEKENKRETDSSMAEKQHEKFSGNLVSHHNCEIARNLKDDKMYTNDLNELHVFIVLLYTQILRLLRTLPVLLLLLLFHLS